MNSKYFDSTHNEWKKSVIKITASIFDAIESLNLSSTKIVVVVDHNNIVKGTITDGDIRRALLNDLTLKCPVKKIIKKEFFVVEKKVPDVEVLRIMQSADIQQIPVVDENDKMVGLHTLNQILNPLYSYSASTKTLEERENIMIIMAGGKGERLMPYTKDCPKPLLPIGNKPVLEHIIEKASNEGFKRFILVTHYLGHMIEEHFLDGSKWDVGITYIKEEKPLGTVGALSLIDSVPDKPFIVANGDVLSEINYSNLMDFHIENNSSATMAVRLHEWQQPFGVVQTEGIEIKGFKEKPVSRTHINAGVYALDPIAINYLEKNTHCDMPTLFERLRSDQKKPIVFPMHESWLDIGRVEDLNTARENNEKTK